MVGELWNSYVLVNLPVTIVLRCTSRNANVFVLSHLQLPDIGAIIGTPDGATVLHLWKNDLFIQQSSVSDGMASPYLVEYILLPIFGRFL